MGVVVPHRAIDAIGRASDPKQAIIDFVGDLSTERIPFNRILVGPYMRPEKTKGGIIRPDANKEEDVWQGKVGLVLKWGTQAFLDDAEYKFSDAEKAMVGEWVLFEVINTKIVMINDYPCRLLRDSNILMIVTDPNRYF